MDVSSIKNSIVGFLESAGSNIKAAAFWLGRNVSWLATTAYAKISAFASAAWIKIAQTAQYLWTNAVPAFNRFLAFASSATGVAAITGLGAIWFAKNTVDNQSSLSAVATIALTIVSTYFAIKGGWIPNPAAV